MPRRQASLRSYLFLLSAVVGPLYFGSLLDSRRRQTSAKDHIAWLKGKTVGVLHFCTNDNKLKPFSCKCGITLDGFPWQSTEWPILNRQKMALGGAESVTRVAYQRGS